ncbi:hypothetical protein [Microvirga massiliensis]|uniref:hypothetical protein n=1 Tax=Microvirga massiliensis TaxID=1033741 RepID=UPI00062BB9E0|nr:hypothetical protein [Microvirga massiliensis]
MTDVTSEHQAEIARSLVDARRTGSDRAQAAARKLAEEQYRSYLDMVGAQQKAFTEYLQGVSGVVGITGDLGVGGTPLSVGGDEGVARRDPWQEMFMGLYGGLNLAPFGIPGFSPGYGFYWR